MTRVFFRIWTLALLVSSASPDEPASATSPTIRRRKIATSAPIVPIKPAASTNKSFALPPLPVGVTELKFADLFIQPVGPRGLVYSTKCLALDGKRIRVLGYMVEQRQPLPDRFLLSPLPAHLDEEEYGFAEDLPPQSIHVLLPHEENPTNTKQFALTPGVLLLTGTLHLGPQNEADGRVSHVRLELDAPPSEVAKTVQEKASAF